MLSCKEGIFDLINPYVVRTYVVFINTENLVKWSDISENKSYPAKLPVLTEEAYSFK